MKLFVIRSIRVNPWPIFLIVAACLLLTPTHSQTQSRNVKALFGGTLIDGYGSTPLRNSVVIIEGERIKSRGPGRNPRDSAGAEVISTEGMSVLPGRWDMHVHLM